MIFSMIRFLGRLTVWCPRIKLTGSMASLYSSYSLLSSSISSSAHTCGAPLSLRGFFGHLFNIGNEFHFFEFPGNLSATLSSIVKKGSDVIKHVATFILFLDLFRSL